ncbi:MAG: histidine kinase [Ilumatobacter sp.]|uniref:sensor histidine kinase n=1 Tax=Ilumatobacter sp. TaxID=1967498 RepID=UPI002627B9D4|nr:histidine kinase [Ilumatobacter sp.]MDJ0768127.1 histidine kinase [Ilumatobacter sp.]
MSEQPHPEGVRLSPWRVPPWAIDTVFVAVIVVAFIVRPFTDDIDSYGWVDWFGGAAAVLALLSRRRFPLATLTVAVAATVVAIAASDRPSLIMPVVLVALYTVATRFHWKVAIAAGAATTLVFAVLVIALIDRGEIAGAGLAAIAWPAFAVAAGTAVRTTRENIAAAHERARRAEETRELEARRRVVEERLRIARDVHDLVAHHIAVVNVQAGVASHVVRSDPDAAADALGIVRNAAATVVTELGELLSVLRASDEADDPTEPTPDLSAIGDLVSSFAASGLEVGFETTGSPRPLSPTAQLAGYRVVQEALTNAHKYGDGSATVAQRFGDDALEIVVTNPVGSRAGDGSGLGLLGMRERLEAVGGSLDIDDDRTHRRFSVTAVIPAQGST